MTSSAHAPTPPLQNYEPLRPFLTSFRKPPIPLPPLFHAPYYIVPRHFVLHPRQRQSVDAQNTGTADCTTGPRSIHGSASGVGVDRRFFVVIVRWFVVSGGMYGLCSLGGVLQVLEGWGCAALFTVGGWESWCFDGYLVLEWDVGFLCLGQRFLVFVWADWGRMSCWLLVHCVSRVSLLGSVSFVYKRRVQSVSPSINCFDLVGCLTRFETRGSF